jgi:hypothetical protein
MVVFSAAGAFACLVGGVADAARRGGLQAAGEPFGDREVFGEARPNVVRGERRTEFDAQFDRLIDGCDLLG